MSTPQMKANGKGKKRAAKRKEKKEESSESEMSVSEAEDEQLKENGSSSDEEMMDIANPSNVYINDFNKIEDKQRNYLNFYVNLYHLIS